MKKLGVKLLFLLLVVSLSFSAIAQTNNSNASKSIDDKAYSCVMGKVSSSDGKTDNCASLSIEEQAFAVLTTGKCTQSLISKSRDSECWPAASCDLKQTAIASLALNSVKGRNYLSAKNITPTDINWFLQVDTDGESKCSVTYNSKSYNFRIMSDKRIDSISGSCFKTSRDSYWLQIDRSCLPYSFEFTCEKDFTSNTVYSKKGEEKYYISSDTKSSSANGKLTHQINSYCIADRGKCDYEGTAWTAMLLSANKGDFEQFMPYLISFAEENQRFGSYAFLYQLTGFSEYYSLLQKYQKDSGYFDFSSPYKKGYDTALTMLSIGTSSSNELAKIKDWLSNTQDSAGCWGSLRDTAFLLYAGWPSRTPPIAGPSSTQTCQSKGGFCLSNSECSSVSGSLMDYSCAGASVCCSKNIAPVSCSSKSGILCSSSQSCSGNVVPSSDLGTCCVSGTCIQQDVSTTDCEAVGYSCLSSSCFSDQETKPYSCGASDSKICCGAKSQVTTPSSGGVSWWVWVLVILVIIILALVIFRKKIFKSKGFKEGSVDKTRPPFGGIPPLMPLRRPTSSPPYRPTQSNYSPGPASQPKAAPMKRNSEKDRELDETFKKLKDISK
ncbi:MAG: hypothetical protein AABW73_02880 [Nanoarchaeota archaeon]